MRVGLACLILVLAAACGDESNGGGGRGDAATDAPGGDGDGDGDGDAGSDADIDGPGVTHTVFTTSTTMPPSIGVDAFTLACNELAADAGLVGDFVPLVELDNDPLLDRLSIRGPVLNTNGEVVATSIEEFETGLFLATNGFSESGGAPGSRIAWIGDQQSNTCANWSSSDDVLTGGQGFIDVITFTRSSTNISCATIIQRSVQCISQ